MYSTYIIRFELCCYYGAHDTRATVRRSCVRYYHVLGQVTVAHTTCQREQRYCYLTAGQDCNKYCNNYMLWPKKKKKSSRWSYLS